MKKQILKFLVGILGTSLLSGCHREELGPDGKKLSKHLGSKTLRDYRKEGMTPDDIRAMTRAA